MWVITSKKYWVIHTAAVQQAICQSVLYLYTTLHIAEIVILIFRIEVNMQSSWKLKVTPILCDLSDLYIVIDYRIKNNVYKWN